MNLVRAKNLMNPARATTLAAACVFVMSCTKGGSISTTGGSSSVSGTLGISKVYPTAAGDTWSPITVSGRYYLKGLDVSVSGSCSRGIATIKVNEGGSNYSETTSCDDSGSFVWEKLYASGSGEGDKTLTFTAYDSTGLQITSATASVDVRVDNTPPSVPVVTLPASNPYSHSGATGQYTVTGTVSVPDCDHLTGPGGVTITPNGGSGVWSYSATLTSGASLDFTFYAWDTAGNESAGVTQRILWSPNVIMYAFDAISGGTIADSSAAAFSLEGTQERNAGQTSDAFTSYSLRTGFNYIINPMRGL